MNLQILAATCRKTAGYGKKLTPAFLRANLDHAPNCEEHAAFKREIERQVAIRSARSARRESSADLLAVRLFVKERSGGRGRFEMEAEYRRNEARRQAAKLAVKAGARDAETMQAAGLGYLIGKKLAKSKAGSWGHVEGAKVFALNGDTCELLGKEAGPANY